MSRRHLCPQIKTSRSIDNDTIAYRAALPPGRIFPWNQYRPETGGLPSVFPENSDSIPQIGIAMTRAEIERNEWLDK